MKSAATIVSLAAAASAAAINTRSEQTQPFTGLTSRSGDYRVHLRSIEAHNGKLLIGADATPYCPPAVSESCPPSSNSGTAYIYTPLRDSPSTGDLNLDVAVPGGQSVYVDSNGVLSYPIAHSAPPLGATRSGFKYVTPATEQTAGYLSFDGETPKGHALGFLACPSGDVQGAYEITVGYENAPSDCIGVQFATNGYDNGPSAYEYTA